MSWRCESDFFFQLIEVSMKERRDCNSFKGGFRLKPRSTEKYKIYYLIYFLILFLIYLIFIVHKENKHSFQPF